MTTHQKINRIIFTAAIIASFGLNWPFDSLLSAPNPEAVGTTMWLNKEMQVIQAKAPNLNKEVLRLSLIAYMNAFKRGYVTNPILTVIDFSKPSTEKRMWVFDLKRNRQLFYTWVSHGKNSGGLNANSFSNSPGSLKSSLGVFVTADPYIGGKGYSLRLRGLEEGINNNAYDRDIVIHGAWYVNPDTIRRYGQIGRSWGCPAVSNDTVRPLVDSIKNHSVVVAYYPDRKWLSQSSFLSA